MAYINVLIYRSQGYGDTSPWAIQVTCPGSLPVLYGITKNLTSGKWSLNHPVCASTARLQDLRMSIPVGTLSPAKSPQQVTAFIKSQPLQHHDKWNEQSWVLECLDGMLKACFIRFSSEAIQTLVTQKEFILVAGCRPTEGPWYDTGRKRAQPIQSQCFKVERTRTQAHMTSFIFRVQLGFLLFAMLSACGIAGIFTGSFEIDSGPLVKPSWSNRMVVAAAGFCPRPFKCPHTY